MGRAASLGVSHVIAILAICVGAASPAPASAATTGRLLVTTAPQFEGRAHMARARALIAQAGGRAVGTIAALDTTVVRPPARTGIAAFARTLRRLPGVRRVEVEHRHALRYVPNDPALVTGEPKATSPDTPLQWWARRTGLFAAWDVTRGDGVRIAVIDTGVDGAHPEFAGRIAAAIDDDPAGIGTAATDEVGHGTHVASMACAAGDNRIGLAGAGFGCRLLIYKSDLSDGSVARTIIAATDAGAHAINMSFGTDGSEPAATVIVDAIDYAVRRGVVLVAAAADEPVEEQGDPANVLQPTGSAADLTAGKGLSVTAANFLDQRASFAGKGTQISLAAYGAYNVSGGPRGIFGAFPANSTTLERATLLTPACNCRASLDGDDRYAYLQGTSMAAPIVAATAGLVRELNPDMSALEIVQLLKTTASRPEGQGWNPDLGWGILNAGAALAAARIVDHRPPSSRIRRPQVSRTGRASLRWTVKDRAPTRLQASGIDTVEVWRSVDGRRARRIARTRRRSVRVRVARGRKYEFFTVAVDRAGNREPVPTRADIRIALRPRSA